MKIIFLDIDGVLVTGKYSRKQYDEKDWKRDAYGDAFDPTAVAALTTLIASTGADLVISSTWRHSGIVALREMWEKRKLPGQILDVTPGSAARFRGLEIDAWLKTKGFSHINWSSSGQAEYCQKSGIESYLIIDDDSDMTLNQLNHFICTNPETGLTHDDVERGTERLNGGIKGWRPFRANEQ